MALDTKEARRERYKEIIQSFTLLDDVFMTAVFQDSLPCVDLVLQIILDRPNLHATHVVTQDTVKNLHGHDVRLDIHAFADGQEFNIEIQRARKGAAPRRARYHSSVMDANALPESTNYDDLPESYVIFITETDVLGKGLPLYVIERTIRGDGSLFDDGTHIVYVNSSITDTNTPLGRLMHDFRCTKPAEMYYDVLAERTGAFKTREKGVTGMNAALEKLIDEVTEEKKTDWIAEGMERGMENGRETERIMSIRTLMTTGPFTAEKAMEMLAIPKEKQEYYKAKL